MQCFLLCKTDNKSQGRDNQLLHYVVLKKQPKPKIVETMPCLISFKQNMHFYVYVTVYHHVCDEAWLSVIT